MYMYIYIYINKQTNNEVKLFFVDDKIVLDTAYIQQS